MTEDEFDPVALAALIAEAIVDEKPRALFRHGDTTLLSVISDVLSEWMPQAERTLALTELRDRLYADIETTDVHTLHSLMANVKTEGKVVVPFWNIKDPDVVFVSDAPPYGDAGNIFAQALKRSGFSSRHIAWTFWNRTNREEEVEKWVPYLYSELRAWNPKLIVTLGAGASVQLLGDISKLSDVRGALHWVGPWPIMPTYSPLYANKSSKTDQLIQDLTRAYDFTYGNMKGDR